MPLRKPYISGKIRCRSLLTGLSSTMKYMWSVVVGLRVWGEGGGFEHICVQYSFFVYFDYV